MLDKSQIVAALHELGLTKGDKLMLHSSVVSLGEVAGGPQAVLDAFLETLGESGTLMVPIFGKLGVLTELVRNDPRAVKSDCPVGTVAAIGKDAVALCKDHWKAETAHAAGTPFHRLAELDGKICLLGVDQDRNTLLHGIEAMLQLPYMNSTTRTFTLPDGQELTKTWKFYPGPHRDFIGLDKRLQAAGLIRQMRIGNAEVRLMPARKVWDFLLDLGKENPAFVLCDNPACADCVSQRAAIDRAAFAKESFVLAMASRLAGRYVPEMIENLQACGINAVELDFIQGKSIAQYPAGKIAAFAQEFRDAGIKVTSLRLEFLPDSPEAIADSCQEAKVEKLVLPLVENVDNYLNTNKLNTISLEFSNQGLGGAAFAALHQRLAKTCGVRFNPVNFVKAGEMPFLRSYGAGRFIRTMSSLDVNDALWDGAPRALARGNAEIKELVSIIRCRNFPGLLVLGGGAPCAQPAREFLAGFRALLNSI
ncbi:MAG: AAC(3) family N-acetyltransferase [Victivallales bacterium]|nr:AAC(3) family N-acetyltransferase [Victivallales bacterium]